MTWAAGSVFQDPLLLAKIQASWQRTWVSMNAIQDLPIELKTSLMSNT